VRHLAILLVTALAGSSVSRQAPMISVEELIEGVAASEGKLLNVRIEAVFSSETWDREKQLWEDAGGGKVSAWYPGVPGSKKRIELRERRLRWVNGRAPFSEDTFTVAYDGRASRTLYMKMGPSAAPDTTLRGTVEAKRPFFGVEDSFGTGWGISIYGIGDQVGQRFSEQLRKIRQSKDVTLSLTNARLGDTECICVTGRIEGHVRRTWFLDPARGFALLKTEDFAADGTLRRQRVVEALLEPAPGIFYPGKASDCAWRNGEPWVRSTYQGSAIVVNDPQFTDDVYTIRWPNGTIVHDMIADVVFTVGQSEKELNRIIDANVRAAFNMTATAPSRSSREAPAGSLQGSPVELPEKQPAAPEQEEAETSQGCRATVLIALIAAVCIMVGLGYRFLRQRRTGRTCASVFLLGLLLIAVNATRAQSYSFAIDELGQQRVYNCGLNSTAFLLQYFGRPFEMPRLAAELNAGGHWELPVAAVRIKQVLEVVS